MAKKPCATAPAVFEPRKSQYVRTQKRVTQDAHTSPETASCVMIKDSMLTPPHISKNAEKARATLTKVLTALGSLGSSRKKNVTHTVTRIARPRQTFLPDNLGECISQDAAAVSHLGWEEFVWRRRG